MITANNRPLIHYVLDYNSVDFGEPGEYHLEMVEVNTDPTTNDIIVLLRPIDSGIQLYPDTWEEAVAEIVCTG